MAYRRSLDFLPSVFRTDVNDKFLHATVDQLISEPELRRLDGYVGRRFSPVAGPDDSFINELSDVRQDYQLEPHTTYVGPDGKVKFTAGYIDLLRRIESLGGFANNHARLFTNTTYNYDGFIDYDKFLNYSQYYWLPNGPDPVSVFATEVPMEQDFEVTPPALYQITNGKFDFENFDNQVFDVSENSISRVREDGYKFDKIPKKINPTIRVARGGTYKFNVNQTGHGFYIQTQPGTSDELYYQGNLSSRDVYGVENNGEDLGTITFKVPARDAQDTFIRMPVAGEVDLVAYSTKKRRAFRYNEIHYRNYNDFISQIGDIDGTTAIENKTIIFLKDPALGKNPEPWRANANYFEGDLVSYDSKVYRVLSDFTARDVFTEAYLEVYDLQNSWYNPEPFDPTDHPYDTRPYDVGYEVPQEQRRGIFTITVNQDGYIVLVPGFVVPRDNKVNVLGGIQYGNKQMYRTTDDDIIPTPMVTSNLDKLYYVDALDPNIGGIIEIIEQNVNLKIDVVGSILGKTKYESPNGVKFTNGLKIRFLTDVVQPEYADKTYYVEGVGKAIELIYTEDLIATESWLATSDSPYDSSPYDSEGYSQSVNSPITPDYMVIKRNSIEKSAWTRQNRWFHKDVIELTSRYNKYQTIVPQNSRAKRPIIEFDANLQLYNFGQTAKKPVDVIDRTTLDAFSIVEGNPVILNDASSANFTGPADEAYAFKISKIAEGFTVVNEIVSADGIVNLQMKQSGLNSYYVDTMPLLDGMRVIFLADTDINVRNKIYTVKWINPQSSFDDRRWNFDGDGSTSVFPLNYQIINPDVIEIFINGADADVEGYTWEYVAATQSIEFDPVKVPPDNSNVTVNIRYNNQIHLVQADDGVVEEGDCVYVKSGLINQGKMFQFADGEWIETQQKTSVNQAPKFDLYDLNDVSYSDLTKYPSTDFIGNELFGYEHGSGAVDSILGIKLKYRNINNIGDILFADFITTGSITYREGQTSITQSTIGSKIRENFPNKTFTYRNQWRKAKDKSRQAQLQSYFATDYLRNLFRLNVMPDGIKEDKLTNIIVYVNNKLVYNNRYDLEIEDNIAYLQFDTELTPGDKLDIKIYSSEVNDDSVFEVPDSFTNNPFNQEISYVTLGQMRNHILHAIEDISQLSDEEMSEFNLRDTQDVKAYQGSILQHTGSTHLANFFLNDTQTNFIDAIIHSQREYVRFKNRLLQLAGEVAVPTENASQTLERVMKEIVSNKNKNFAFFTSDMLPFGEDYNKRIYQVIDTRLSTYDLTQPFDMSVPSDKAVLVYLNGRQLLLNKDYTIPSDKPVVDFNLEEVTLNENDIIEIREYISTDGSYIPPTPTKLGLHPLFIPGIVKDGYGENERDMIRGHDGSLLATFGDTRDEVLLDFETRIYNNIKTIYNPDRFDVWDYIPGGFRNTDYSIDEFNSILSSHFSSWSGSNAISVSDYRQFVANDPFTFNYGRFTNRLDGKLMPANSWRGIYNYYYDTEAPHLRPWEMLGFTTMPSWWEFAYGPAPYTAGNEVLWKDLEAGRILFGNRAGIDSRFARPGLSKIIPVDLAGELLSPMEAVAKDINELDVTGFFKFGDIGPVESAWRQSSEFPFVLQIAIALMKPTEYFGNNINANKQVLGFEDSQVIFSDTNLKSVAHQLMQNELNPDGSFYRVNSYTTWVSEFCKSRGLDVTKTLGERFRNIESKLGYKVGGYTDKKYLKVITDQYTPASNNPGVIIPDDDFDIVLSKSAPVYNLTYSGVIITKTADGYSVTGYDDNKPYFTIEASAINNNKSYIKVGKLAITKYHDGNGDIYRVPYGTEFFSIDQTADFLLSYGRYLTRQGFQFTDKVDADASWYLDWDLAVREYLFYVQQGWDVDIALSVSPVGSKINFRSLFGTVDALSNRPLNTRILDEDFKIVRTSDYTVNRNARDFSAKINSERGIYLLDIDVVEYEHVLIFNNVTRFNDIIYDPVTGDRQHRLRLQGFKTSDWDGTYSAAGFVINEDNVEDWRPGQNYNKGDIVIFKSDYFTASNKIPATVEFEFDKWIKTEYSDIKKGLLPNLVNRAGLSKSFYNVNEVNLEQDSQKLSKNLIGFEARSYMEDIGISDTSQFKFYQGMLSQKGTNSSLDKLLKAKVDNFGGSANVYEEWAVRLGAYGATDSTRNLQIGLDEAWAVKDPLVIELLNDREPTPTGHKGIRGSDLLVKNVPFDKNYLNHRSTNTNINDLYTAGYAQLSDVDYTAPTRGLIDTYVQSDDVGTGDLVWIAADRNNDWNIYRIDETDIRLESANIISNGNATIKCVNNHGLEKNDLILIKADNTTPKVLGFFTVTQIVDLRTFVVSTGFGSVQIKPFSGFVYKLKNVRFETSRDVAASEPLKGWRVGDKLFIDKASDNGWGIFENQAAYSIGPYYSVEAKTANDKLGYSVATDYENYFMIAGRPGQKNGKGGVVIYNITSQGELQEAAALSSTSDGTSDLGFSVSASASGYFAAGAPTSDDVGTVSIFTNVTQNGRHTLRQTITPESLDTNGEFGYSVKLSSDSHWLAVGQPGVDEGYVYLYQKRIVKVLPPASVSFTGDGSTTDFVLTGDAANPSGINAVVVIVDSLILVPNEDFTLLGNTISFAVAPTNEASIDVTVSRGEPEQTYTADGLTSSFMLTGDNATPSSIYALKVVAGSKIQIPYRDFTLETILGSLYIVFNYIPDEFTEIIISQNTHYEFVTAFTDDNTSVGDRFGESVEFTTNALQLIVGAPGTENESGAVYVYDRTVETYYSDGVTASYFPDTQMQGQAIVYVDDDLQEENVDYYQFNTEIRFINIPSVGSLIRIETNNFVLTKILTQESANDELEDGSRFGQSLVICPTNCSLYIGSPLSTVNDKINCGKVYRFINEGRFFGSIRGTVQYPVLTQNSKLLINEFIVSLATGDNVDQIVNKINAVEIPGVFASNDNGYLFVEADSMVVGHKLLITSLSGNAFTDIGIDLFHYQQTINCPEDDYYVEFGRSIAVSPSSDLIAIGSSRANNRIDTTIDSKTTYFDARATSFNDLKKQSGAVWLYQYISTAKTTVDNPGAFIAAQRLVHPKIDNLDEYGISVALSKTKIFVGAPGDDTAADNAGTVFSFVNHNNTKIWQTLRSEEPKVDIDLINRVFLYNKETNTVVTELDFIDPVKNKISGLAAQEITYQTPFDPAFYNNDASGRVWGKEYVGKVWWDISQTRWLNYEQGNVSNRGMNWNSAFPGSTIICYEWVESLSPPSQFADVKDPTAYARSNQFNLVADIDPNTGIVINKYYYWVAGKRTIPAGVNRKYSTVNLENLIANPRTSGIPFIAFIASNAVALFNCSQLLQGKNIVLSIDYDAKYNENSIHSEFQLIAENDENSIPSNTIVQKMIDSLAGADKEGNLVPDIKLSVNERYGPSYRPRQTVFRDRKLALKAASQYINLVLAKIPVRENKDTTNLLAYDKIPTVYEYAYDDEVNNKEELGYLNIALFDDGYRVLVKTDRDVSDRWAIYRKESDAWVVETIQTYDNRRYLETVDWIKPGFDDPLVTTYTVTYTYEVSSITPQVGDTVKVRDSGNGRYIILKYTANDEYEIIKEEAATYKISDSIWDEAYYSQGFDRETFDIQTFDDWPTVEIQNILHAVYNDIFTGDEQVEKNRWFLIMLQHLLSEQKYADWAFKTSFIKVEQRDQKAISQIPSLQKDRQDSLKKYIEEIKPYHTKIREFVNTHEGMDHYKGDTTDFDVPAYYEPSIKKYRSPTGLDEIDDVILDRPIYKPWLENHTLEIESVHIENSGSGYLGAPDLVVVSATGSGAELEAVVVNGQITHVNVINPGSGYITTPTIEFLNNAGGSGAVLIPIVANHKVRSIKDVIKFDRVPNNGGFLVEFKDSSGFQVDIREQRKSRLFGEHGVLDELLEALSMDADGETHWIKETEEEILWPVPTAVNYRIFEDAGGRIQVQYKKIPGGWTAAKLETYLRELGTAVGVDGLDISGTTVVEDGNMSLYAPTVLEWLPFTRYDRGDIVVYDNKAYVLREAIFSTETGEIFDATDFREYLGEEFDSHINRIWTYYQPQAGQFGKDLGQLLEGIEYPGVKVQGASFREEPGFDVGNFDMNSYDQYEIGPEGVAILDQRVLDQNIYSTFLDTALGTRPEDIITAGGGFVDTYSSHAPEEAVPGRVYDTLSITVHTLSTNFVSPNAGYSPEFNVNKYYSNGVNKRFKYRLDEQTHLGDYFIVHSKMSGPLYKKIGENDFAAPATIVDGGYYQMAQKLAYSIDWVNEELVFDEPFPVGDLITIINISQIGQDIIADDNYQADGSTTAFKFSVNDATAFTEEAEQKHTALILVNGLPVTNYTIEESNGFVYVVFATAPEAGSHVHLVATYNETSTISYINTQYAQIDSSNRTLVLNRDIQSDRSKDTVMIVELNGSRLRPGNSNYFTGDGIATDFPLPSSADDNYTVDTLGKVNVWKNGEKVDVSEYEIEIPDDSTVPRVIFLLPPADGDDISLTYIAQADYIYNENTRTVTVLNNVEVPDGSLLAVTAFGNHDPYKFKTKVFKGVDIATDTYTVEIGFGDSGFGLYTFDTNYAETTSIGKKYVIDSDQNNAEKVFVTVDGKTLTPSFDYTVSGGYISIADTILIRSDSIVIVTWMDSNVFVNSSTYRLFKDLNDNVKYNRVALVDATVLEQDLGIKDEVIHVSNAEVLGVPDIDKNVPGVIFIGSERITFWNKDGNVLSNIRRGTGGTAASELYTKGSVVVDASGKSEIPNANMSTWYDVSEDGPTNGTGLMLSNTIQVNFLKESAGIIPFLGNN